MHKTVAEIAISRMGHGEYEWHLMLGPQVVEQGAGEPSIAASLSAALDGFQSDDIGNVQVAYRGVQMGTWSIKAVQEASEEIADQISAAYSGLV